MKPTPPQMRLLHVLANSQLTIRRHEFTVYEWKDRDGKLFIYNFHPVVAENVVMHGWAKAVNFNPHRVDYRISREGKQMLKELCEHRHELEDSTEILGGNLICKKCGRSVRCKSKQPTAHGANRWNVIYGPMCNKCWEFLYGE